MGRNEFLFLAAVIFIGYRWQRSHSGVSAVDYAYSVDAAQFASLAGSNFTNSYWDATNGQPGYMYGNTPGALQGGLVVQGLGPQLVPGMPQASVFGHM